MIDENIQNVEFYVANTDKQALATSKAPNRIVLGEEVTKGLGAGGDPAVGKQAAVASTEVIKNIVKGADMVFIAAGMSNSVTIKKTSLKSKRLKASSANVAAITAKMSTRPL